MKFQIQMFSAQKAAMGQPEEKCWAARSNTPDFDTIKAAEKFAKKEIAYGSKWRVAVPPKRGK